jgi:hypothetical protein
MPRFILGDTDRAAREVARPQNLISRTKSVADVRHGGTYADRAAREDVKFQTFTLTSDAAA